jgi:hypothetical protein
MALGDPQREECRYGGKLRICCRYHRLIAQLDSLLAALQRCANDTFMIKPYSIKPNRVSVRSIIVRVTTSFEFSTRSAQSEK